VRIKVFVSNCVARAAWRTPLLQDLSLHLYTFYAFYAFYAWWLYFP
jgi:hypothetical protein